jgi:curli biogenesis system outer membrane secretion channel CsgG|tara:strand:+ start:1042 stop:1947 length:906 start_codon:yes stop_codon:yes gene_type:complete
MNYKKLIYIFLFTSTFLVAQDLPVVAVTEIKSSVDSGRYYDYKNTKSENFQNMLETQLVKLGRFKIIERNRVSEVLSEQALQGEFSNNNTKMRVGAVDYIVYGSVTRFGSRREEINISGFASVKLITEFGIDLKVVNALNGEIIRAENVNVEMITGKGVATDGFSSGETKADPLSEIQRKAAKRVTSVIAESIFPIRVITFKEDNSKDCCTYLNYGSAMFSVGDKVKVVREGEKFIDPETGIDLGSSEETIGTLEISEVTEKFSKARIISGDIPKAKDLVRFIERETSKEGKQREKRGRTI